MSLAAALVTIALKTGAWLVTGSVGLLSDAAEYAEHVKKYERWVAARRPKLHKWLEQNS